MGGMFVADPHGATLGVGVGVGVFPLLAAAPPHPFPTSTTPTTPAATPRAIHYQSNLFTQTGNNEIVSSSTATCHDCGNQAKKDCRHRRCRTCCKSRGFECSTHLKSTWVPAARRRERLSVAASSSAAAATTGCSSGSTSGSKKPRLIGSQRATTVTSRTSTSNTPPRSVESASTHQDASFKETLPGQVRAPAVFKCVRVTAVDDGEDEFAYQAIVKIGGHVFKGFLYDQGIDNQDDEEERVAPTGSSDHHNVAGSFYPNMSELHLGNSRIRVESATNILDPYVASASGGGAPPGMISGGSTFGNQI